jgi:arylsulfatase A-like enzyme
MLIRLFVVLAGCSGNTEQAPPGATALPSEQAGRAVPFVRMSTVSELELPANTRPEGMDVPTEIPITGPWTALRTNKGVTAWEGQLPIRSRSLFFTSASKGMSVWKPGGTGPQEFDRKLSSTRDGSWRFTAETLVIRSKDGPPEDGWTMRYARATERERALHFDTWSEDNPGSDRLEFVQRSLQLGPDTRTGLLLPAPSSAAWSADLPPAATLQLDATVLPPETSFGDLESDGAVLIVELVLGAETVEVLRTELEVGDWKPLRVDLSEHAGKLATVRFRTEGGGTETLDHVFLADPVIYTPKQDPQRLLMVFLDTTRPDHMGLYGYEDHETTPRLDAWAASSAVVFEDARSVAPWTLPSTRAALSGRQPELWPDRFGPILPEILGHHGFATGAFVGNVYLSSNFDMSRGWSQHGCVNWPTISEQIAQVEGFLERYPDRDVAVMLHTMDMHLPYTEPRKYETMWAGEPPAGLNENSQRRSILKAAKKDKAAVKDWLVARYDQNLRYTDDELTELIEDMGPQTYVVIFADHGEEFFEHDDFEHGHTLYDELLRIPMILSGPGLQAGRVQAPSSILDLSPTILDLLGLPADPSMAGTSLLPAARGDQAALKALEDRPHSVGRPLYGDERWGVIAQGLKWTIHEGKEEVYDLTRDRAEQDDLRGEIPLDPLRRTLGEGLDQDSPLAWRFDIAKSSRSPEEDRVVHITHPSGFEHAWLGQDPFAKSAMVAEVLEDGSVSVIFAKGSTGGRELYLVPRGAIQDIDGLTIEIGDQQVQAPPASSPPLPDGKAHRLWATTVDGRSWRMGYAVAPVPAEGMQLVGVDDEVAESLKGLGYIDDEDHGEEDEGDSP